MDNSKITPLYISCQKNHVDVVQALMKRDEIQVNFADEDGVTPLIIATYLGRSRIVKVLLSSLNSASFSEQTAAPYANKDMRVENWKYLDDEIDEEGRTICQNLFSLKNNQMLVVQ